MSTLTHTHCTQAVEWLHLYLVLSKIWKERGGGGGRVIYEQGTWLCQLEAVPFDPKATTATTTKHPRTRSTRMPMPIQSPSIGTLSYQWNVCSAQKNGKHILFVFQQDRAERWTSTANPHWLRTSNTLEETRLCNASDEAGDTISVCKVVLPA